VNSGNIDLELSIGANVSEAIEEISLQYPGLNLNRMKFLVSLNYEYTDNCKILHEDDELALIPPVSGG